MPSFNIYVATMVALVSTCAIAQSDTVPVTGLLGNASVTTNNPIGAIYSATLPNSELTTIRGSVVGITMPDGVGVNFQVSLAGFPAAGGPFIYHIHNNPISSDGNCSSAGSHVDPYQRGEMPFCDASLPETCQVGDLAGKHGAINTTDFAANYVDQYASTIPGTGVFIGNRSLVVHFANKTIITCGNFTLLEAGTNTSATITSSSSSSSNSSGSVMATGSATSTVSSTSATGTGSSKTSASAVAVSTGGAAELAINAGVISLGCFAFAMLL